MKALNIRLCPRANTGEKICKTVLRRGAVCLPGANATGFAD
jgi:hypothetical protein